MDNQASYKEVKSLQKNTIPTENSVDSSINYCCEDKNTARMSPSDYSEVTRNKMHSKI